MGIYIHSLHKAKLLEIVSQAQRSFKIFVTICQSARLSEILQILTFPTLRFLILLSKMLLTGVHENFYNQ